MQYRISRLDFLLPQKKKQRETQKSAKSPDEAAWKRVFGEATAWSDVHSLRLHSTVHEVPHFKTACRLVLHITETLYTGPCCCPTRVDFVLFQHMYTANRISKTLCTFISYKNNWQQIFMYYFSTGINVYSVTFSLFFVFYIIPKKIFSTRPVFCGHLEI